MILPNHIGLIPDGNRRWARKNGLSIFKGHEVGAKNIENFIKWCIELGIKKVSIYILSTENLKNRSKEEINHLLNLLNNYLQRWKQGEFYEFLKKYEIQINIFGNYFALPKSLVNLFFEIMEKTKKYKNFIINLLIAYGGTYEILQAIKRMIKNNVRITEKNLRKFLFVKDDVDLIIRTGGFSRLSNFLPLQSTYAEIYVTKKYWPEFTKRDLIKALKWYSNIQRNFGK